MYVSKATLDEIRRDVHTARACFAVYKLCPYDKYDDLGRAIRFLRYAEQKLNNLAPWEPAPTRRKRGGKK